jgi:hypothetical protein
MLSHLPLDDELNELFYVEEGAWRLVWANALGHCVLRREVLHLEFEQAAAMIARGELLWVPPGRFESLDAATPLDVVQRERVLIAAFLRSPAGQRMTKWTMRLWLELRNREVEEWLARRTLTRGDLRAESDD